MTLAKCLFACCFTIAVISIPAALFLIKFSPSNPIGQDLKKFMIKYPSIVRTVNLNEPGDNRYAYVRTSQPLIVNLFFDQENPADTNIKSWIAQMVKETTGREVVCNENPITIDLSLTDLNQIRSQIPSSPGALHIIWLNTYQKKPSYAGVTINRDTIFLFKTTMTQLVRTPAEVAGLEQSTLKHEWGHLLGLEHNELPGCLMYTVVEVEGALLAKNEFPTDYCWNELDELAALRR